MRLIKRYSNRKLYDTISKGYITLESLESLIKDGEEVQIVDNDSGENITAATLSQIITERARKSTIYSPSLFIQMIRKRGGTMFDYGRKMLQVVGDTVYSLEEEVEKKVKKLVSSGELTEEEGKELTKEMEKQRGAYLQRLEHQLEALTEAILTRFSVPAKDDLEHLKECIERLEKCIENLEQKLSSKGQ